ncbi:MAG: YqaJ viral recombinase family protein [Actinoallomurus sp.]
MTETTTQTRPPFRILLPASAGRTEWLETRRTGIGSSDVADIMDVGYGTPLGVYYDKIGDLPLESDAGEEALWGTLHEETVAREWARRNRSTVRRVGLIARRDARHMMCTLDRRIAECPLNREQRETCALEVKTRNAFVAKRWKREVPDDVLAQTLWQIAVTSYSHVHVAVLIGGNDYRQYVVTRAGNEDVIADIVTVCSRMWHDHIRAGSPPPTTGDPDRLVELYEQLHSGRTGVIDLANNPDLSVEVMNDLIDYEENRLVATAAEKRKKAARARLVGHLGKADTVSRNGALVYSFTSSAPRQNADLDALAERWPAAFADVVTETPSRRLNIAKAHRLEAPKEEDTDGSA